MSVVRTTTESDEKQAGKSVEAPSEPKPREEILTKEEFWNNAQIKDPASRHAVERETPEGLSDNNDWKHDAAGKSKRKPKSIATSSTELKGFGSRCPAAGASAHDLCRPRVSDGGVPDSETSGKKKSHHYRRYRHDLSDSDSWIVFLLLAR